LIPLSIFDEVLAEIKNKELEKVATVNKFLKDCSSLITQKITKLGIDAAKTKNIISENVLSAHIN